MVVESGTMAHTAECRVHRLVADVPALEVLEEVLTRPV
jgi:hypothetical protein